jgi:hypothetical protein
MTEVKVKRLAGIAVACVALVACGDSSGSSDRGSPAGSLPPSVDTTIIVGPDGSSSVIEVPSNGTTAPNATTPDTVGGDGGGPSDPLVDSTGSVGSFAPGILSPKQSGEVVVELRQQSGASPQQASIDHLTSVLRDVAQKTVTGAQGAGIGGGGKNWSADELRALGGAGLAQGNGRAVIHLLFVHGTFEGDDSVLGVAVRGDTAAVFVDRVHAAATPLVGSTGIEVAVVTHEVGHLLGLVDLFLHTGRQDPAHPGHSTDQNSVMYWAVESDIVAQLLQGGPPRDFDSADLADLAAIRNQ